MKFSHISDTHSTFPTLHPDAEFVVHSGDFCPNASRGNLNIEPKFQTQWLKSEIENIKKWLDGRALLICEGNHDFLNIGEILHDYGVQNVISLTNKKVIFRDLNFYGFPYIPYICGEWNFETFPQMMRTEISKMLERLDGSVLDILVAHAPIHGILDKEPRYDNDSLGNSVMASCLVYNVINPWPRFYLHGHIHGSPGIFETNGMLISNAATTQHLLEIEEK